MSLIVLTLTLLEDSSRPRTFMHWRVAFSPTGPRDNPALFAPSESPLEPLRLLELQESLEVLELLELLESLGMLEESWGTGPPLPDSSPLLSLRIKNP